MVRTGLPLADRFRRIPWIALVNSSHHHRRCSGLDEQRRHRICHEMATSLPREVRELPRTWSPCARLATRYPPVSKQEFFAVHSWSPRTAAVGDIRYAYPVCSSLEALASAFVEAG